jgi:hypothetical protein
VTGPAASDAARALRFYESLGFEHTGPKMRMILAPSPYAGPAPD